MGLFLSQLNSVLTITYLSPTSMNDSRVVFLQPLILIQLGEGGGVVVVVVPSIGTSVHYRKWLLNDN
jgi:hypothetical protein